ncbi:MAG TPA: TetR family transcriptional regulator [Aggregatilineales bacterium]|nr:TetR family transcriptional regulator [Aggregatilineales bacterium]
MSDQSDRDEQRRSLREQAKTHREEERQLREQIRLQRSEERRHLRELKRSHSEEIHRRVHEQRQQRPSYRDVERQRREQDILQSASRLLAERGYAELNMDDLAEAVGISKPTLYQHFKSKEDLVRQVVLQSYETMEQQISALVYGSPLERMVQIMRHVLKAKFASSGLTSVLDSITFSSVVRSSPAVQERQARAKQGLTHLVEQAKLQGQIPALLPTPLIVRNYFCLQNLLNDEKVKEEIADSDEKLDEAIEGVVQMFLHGVSVPNAAGEVAQTPDQR